MLARTGGFDLETVPVRYTVTVPSGFCDELMHLQCTIHAVTTYYNDTERYRWAQSTPRPRFDAASGARDLAAATGRL